MAAQALVFTNQIKILKPLGVARANNHGLVFMKTEAHDLDARADEMLARLQAFSAEISTLAAPISA